MLDEVGNTGTHTDTETGRVGSGIAACVCRLGPGLLPKAQALSQTHALGFFQHEGAQGNVRQ